MSLKAVRPCCITIQEVVRALHPSSLTKGEIYWKPYEFESKVQVVILRAEVPPLPMITTN